MLDKRHTLPTLALLAATSLAGQVTAQDAMIEIRDRALYFTGEISPESYEDFLNVTAGLTAGDLDVMVVNSGGGDTDIGREMARWVREMGLDLEVDEVCFSSCANYLFPAADHKIIRDGSFVGWHGSEAQEDILAQGDPTVTAEEMRRQNLEVALKDAFGSSVTDDELAAIVDQQLALSAASRQDEAAFFAELDINPEVSLHGMRGANLEAFSSSGMAGWTYSIEDMAQAGITNVTYEGDRPYELSENVREYLVVIPYDPALIPDTAE